MLITILKCMGVSEVSLNQAKYTEPKPCLCECPGWDGKTLRCAERSCMNVNEACFRGYWNATRDNYDGAPDSSGMFACVGMGTSPAAAVADLLEKEEFHAELRADDEEQS